MLHFLCIYLDLGSGRIVEVYVSKCYIYLDLGPGRIVEVYVSKCYIYLDLGPGRIVEVYVSKCYISCDFLLFPAFSRAAVNQRLL